MPPQPPYVKGSLVDDRIAVAHRSRPTRRFALSLGSESVAVTGATTVDEFLTFPTDDVEEKTLEGCHAHASLGWFAAEGWGPLAILET